jgi:plasmid maintenance system antidote protein VapI
MYLDDLTPALMAKRCRMPEQKIKAIAELKHRITSKIASCFERCFGWPAHVLLTWQLVYDIEERLYHWEDRFQEHFEMHVYGQEFFLARIKSDIKLLKMDRRFLQKLLPARLRKKR